MQIKEARQEMIALGLVDEDQTLPHRPDEPPYMAATLEDLSLSQFQSVEPVRLANGAELAGWQARQTETGWRVLTL